MTCINIPNNTMTMGHSIHCATIYVPSFLLGLLSKEQLLKKLYCSVHDEIAAVMKEDKMVSTIWTRYHCLRHA